MRIDLKGKRALVGGSTGGIGKAIAIELSKCGASVTLMARDVQKLNKTIAELAKIENSSHSCIEVDFDNFDNLESLIKDFFEKNSIDILINNTQGPPAGGPLEKKILDYQNSFDLLFKTHVLTTSLALKGMRFKKWGRIINVASISVKEPLNYLVLSNSMRAALVTWAKSLSLEVAKENITVNNILTGYFDTDRIQKLNLEKAKKMKINTDEVRKAMEEMVPMKRIGNPKEYAYLVAFLASNYSSYITGANIPIDGGLIKSL
jgi:3-oxoacyl-[acyl-carrier protein] reductase